MKLFQGPRQRGLCVGGGVGWVGGGHFSVVDQKGLRMGTDLTDVVQLHTEDCV